MGDIKKNFAKKYISIQGSWKFKKPSIVAIN
jgi:hypothetical protein